MRMLDTNQLDTDQNYDRRILREHYRNHDLVARYWEFGYLGKIWKNRKAIEELDAMDDQGLDDLMTLMRQHVDADIDRRVKARKNSMPSKQELTQAFATLLPVLTPLEKLLLKTHAEYEEGCVPVSRLQRDLKLAIEASILEIYSSIGQKLNDEIPYQPKQTKGSDVNLKFILAAGSDEMKLQLPEELRQLILNGAI